MPREPCRNCPGTARSRAGAAAGAVSQPLLGDAGHAAGAGTLRGPTGRRHSCRHAAQRHAHGAPGEPTRHERTQPTSPPAKNPPDGPQAGRQAGRQDGRELRASPSGPVPCRTARFGDVNAHGRRWRFAPDACRNSGQGCPGAGAGGHTPPPSTWPIICDLAREGRGSRMSSRCPEICCQALRVPARWHRGQPPTGGRREG